MAKRQKNQQIAVAFNYLVKQPNEQADPENPVTEPFTAREFQSLLNRLSNVDPMDDTDPDIVAAIKTGRDLPYLYFEEVEPGLYFGDFEGAYYGQRYRNNVHGEITADSLNLRRFHYLVTRLRDGRIIVGNTYHGHYGDFDGLRSSFSHVLRGDHRVLSKVLKSISNEIGAGHPISLKLTYRKRGERVEHRSLFGTSGEIAIRKSDFGPEFEERVGVAARRIRGSDNHRRAVLAEIVNEADMLELDADDIIGCSAIVRQNGKTRTVYFLGENNQSTKFPIAAEIDQHGAGNRDQIKAEMIRVLRNEIIPLVDNARPA
ncbi:hypothetical protein [Qipengyuania flava]|uniref:hypothetical protein n=1 Tax=Qipengyuania flava TaxID=192812 RepID=UPI001CFECBAA|nr:hypothetical protein [Qipengyuania flava]UOR08503.1 hypothetical protein LCM18_09685 [Qipengyuania flava]